MTCFSTRLVIVVSLTFTRALKLTQELDPHHSAAEVKWLGINPRYADINSIYAHLEGAIGPLYARVDTVLAEAGFAAAKKEVREGRVERDASGRLQLCVVDSNIVPFDLKTTSSGFWKLFSSTAAMDLNGGVYKVGCAAIEALGVGVASL